MDPRRKDQPTILDRHNRTIAQILTRFRNMIIAATEPLATKPEDDNEDGDGGETNPTVAAAGAAIETAALNNMTMETETAALITEIENLLTLNREIKTLWVRGALRQPGEDSAREAELDRKAEVVTGLLNQVVEMRDRGVRERAG